MLLISVLGHEQTSDARPSRRTLVEDPPSYSNVFQRLQKRNRKRHAHLAERRHNNLQEMLASMKTPEGDSMDHVAQLDDDPSFGYILGLRAAIVVSERYGHPGGHLDTRVASMLLRSARFLDAVRGKVSDSTPK